MNLGKCQVTNFGSYASLEFDFTAQGLALLHGPTGAGKSTLADIPCWILFGETAKGGAVDEIRSWQNPKVATYGNLELTLPDGTMLSVTRIRGKASENDLYWTENDGEPARGKDLSDTQKCLEKRLGLTAEIYQAAGYFHEFSAAGLFFVSNAKSRRGILQSLADLSFPVHLADRLSIKRSDVRKRRGTADSLLQRVSGNADQLKKTTESAQVSSESWETQHRASLVDLDNRASAARSEAKARKEALEIKVEAWERAREQELDEIFKEDENLGYVEDLEELGLHALRLQKELKAFKGAPCVTCGAPGGASEKHAKERQLDSVKAQFAAARETVARRAVLQKRLSALADKDNPYIDQLASIGLEPVQLEAEATVWRSQTNPFLAQIAAYRAQLLALEQSVAESTKEVDSLLTEETYLNCLSELTDDLRGKLLLNAVVSTENQVNGYLEKYFESEIKVKFTLEGSDSLKVDIQKSGYACTYKQLSKGQRGLLRLCFVVSVMAATADRYGIHLNAIFMDESLDGLDNDLKVKAFGLFQELSLKHDSVFVIDHADELKQLFDKRYLVTLSEDNSVLQLQD